MFDRYSIHMTYGYKLIKEVDSNGEWVKFEDVKHLLEKLHNSAEISGSSFGFMDGLLTQSYSEWVEKLKSSNSQYAAAEMAYKEYMKSDHFMDWIFPEWLADRLNSQK